MKKKKTLLSIGLLALILVLCVGYAVVSSVDLTISGTAKVKGSDLKVAFNGTTTVSVGDEDRVTATATDGSLTANIAVTDLELNDAVTATYTIKNTETDVNASIIKTSITNDKADYFQVTTDVDSTAKTIDAGSTGTVTVTIKMIKTPVADADSTANIAVQLTASPVQP